ncbi:TonB-dependent siderophore receptor [Exilibacterium tricleocarpae]|uniref:TonB-dependent siderophore receptor n=2 Tax=Exilibacterium tricleocarpae TaxID=2591008 RepID=A0A545TNG4_9GAMM|nr:TonB-dependent siderophore receptor [Exilibacterium tricleocarpae]
MQKQRQGRLAVAVLTATICINSLASAQTTPDSQAETTLDEVVVYGDASQVELTRAFAGGQVARGGRAGLLGNLDFLDSPFSGTAFTQEIIRGQQAESVGDTLLNDPAVRVTKGFGNFQEVYIIRGFPVFSDDITLNGLFGILPRQFVAAEQLERVEVFRGANAFINGAAPGGSGVGGTVNLVAKRAPAAGVIQLTAGYEGAGQLYAATDLAKRFGGENEWGIRFNAVYRDGESAVEDQERELSVFSFGTDYAGENIRFSADIGYQDNHIDNPRPQVTPEGEVPRAPDADANYAQPGTYTDEQQLFGVVRAEFDVSDAVTAWIAAGGREGEEKNILANPRASADGATTSVRFDNVREDSVFSADLGARATFSTGPVNHNLVVSASFIDSDSNNAFALSDSSTPLISDLFTPTPLAELPVADAFTGGVLSDPLTTEEVTNSSVAIANTLGLLSDSLLVTAGLRYQSIETRTFDFNTGVENSRYDKSDTTPVFGAVYKASDNMSFYGNYAESLQPGATAPTTSNNIQVLNAGETLDPFSGDQVELGAKYDGGSFGVTAAVFSLSRQNAIVENQIFKASGEQRNEGLEFSVFGEPVAGIRWLGGITYVDAKFEKTQDNLNEGNTVIGVPEIQANLNGEWDIPAVPGLTVDARVIYTDNQFVNAENTIEIDSWRRVDLGLRYTTEIYGKALTFRGRLDNLTDERYWASTGGFPGANYLIQGDPRTFFMTVSMEL